MNSIALLQFLGLAVVEPGFDQYLKSIGIHERPIFKEDFREYLTVKNAGLSLMFYEESVYIEKKGSPKFNGQFVLASIFFYAEGYEEFNAFKQPLPFGLRFNMTEKEVISELGQPISSTARSGYVRSKWHAQGYDLTLTLNDKKTLILMANVSIPDA